MKNPFGWLGRSRLALEPEAHAMSHPARVLLAEEDATTRDAVAAALRAEGYVVLESDGPALQRRLRAQAAGRDEVEPFDLVIYDLDERQDRVGLDNLAALRRLDWVSPIILVSAAGDEAAQRAQRLGVAAVLPAPVDVAAVRGAALDLVPPV